MHSPIRALIGHMHSPIRALIGHMHSPIRALIGHMHSPIRALIGHMHSPSRQVRTGTSPTDISVVLVERERPGITVCTPPPAWPRVRPRPHSHARASPGNSFWYIGRRRLDLMSRRTAGEEDGDSVRLVSFDHVRDIRWRARAREQPHRRGERGLHGVWAFVM